MTTRLKGATRATALAATIAVLVPTLALAQPQQPAQPGTQPHQQKPAPAQQQKAQSHPVAQAGTAVTCESKKGENKVCLADTSAGVVLQKSTGTAECVLGKTWGYDEAGVWVADGCSGVFQIGAAVKESGATPPPPTAAPKKPTTQGVESWGDFEPGTGFLVGRNSAGELAISAYALERYVNQTPASQTFTDHLGNVRTVDGRNDVWPHRIMVFFKGWVGSPKLIYSVTFWTVLDTNQNAIFANLGYQFHRKFSIYAGFNGNPGTRSLQGSHPYWLGHDRVMADEFFRPFFTAGVYAQGELVKGLWYNVAVGDNNSILGVKSSQLDRSFTTGASMWWMPTTKEFGPKGAYGDFEMHDKVATRFGFSTVRSPEERFSNSSGIPDNTTLRLADSVNVFDAGALAPGVTVNNVDYRILSFDAGVKYKGVFLQTEIYNRWLDNFAADGPLPVASIHDTGFYVQGAFFPVPKKLELYAATSQIYGDKSAGFSNASEYLVGGNFYPFNSRNYRLNLQVIDVNHSPVSSAFGYYIGGQTGTTFSAAFSVFF
ncbi:MAG: DUF3011 domain-containing protein [Bacteroidales bacterium]